MRIRPEAKARKALAQIREKKYDEELRANGYRDIVRYGTAFHEKDCFVVVE